MTEKWSFAAVMDAASKGAGYGGAERRGNDCIAIPNRSGLGVCSTAVPTFPRAVCWHSLWSSSSPQIQNESSEERGSVLIIVGTSFDHHSPTRVTHSNVHQPFESFWASSTLNFFEATNSWLQLFNQWVKESVCLGWASVPLWAAPTSSYCFCVFQHGFTTSTGFQSKGKKFMPWLWNGNNNCI